MYTRVSDYTEQTMNFPVDYDTVPFLTSRATTTKFEMVCIK